MATRKYQVSMKISSQIYNYIFFIFKNLFFNWRIIALQYCVGFYQTSTWISHRFTYIPSHIPPTSFPIPPFFFNINLFQLEANYFTTLYWFCHTLTWLLHGCTRVPHPEFPSHLPPHPIPLGHPSAPAPSTLSHASNLDWQFVSRMIIYMFLCHSPKSSHPRPLPQSPKDCFIHLLLFCCLTYRVIVTIFLNSTYMR